VKQYFNPAAFVTRHDGTYGDSARDVMYGPPSFNTDAALMKNWAIMERYQVQLRFEFFNASTTLSLGTPDMTPTDSTFGQINGGQGSDAANPRVGRLH